MDRKSEKHDLREHEKVFANLMCPRCGWLHAVERKDQPYSFNENCPNCKQERIFGNVPALKRQ